MLSVQMTECIYAYADGILAVSQMNMEIHVWKDIQNYLQQNHLLFTKQVRPDFMLS